MTRRQVAFVAFLAGACVAIPVLLYGNPPLGFMGLGVAFLVVLLWGYLFPAAK